MSHGYLGKIAKQRWTSSEVIVKETPAKSSAGLECQVEAAMRPSSHGSGQITSGNDTDAQDGSSEADVI